MSYIWSAPLFAILSHYAQEVVKMESYVISEHITTFLLKKIYLYLKKNLIYSYIVGYRVIFKPEPLYSVKLYILQELYFLKV